jgi:hypothetical protein
MTSLEKNKLKREIDELESQIEKLKSRCKEINESTEIIWQDNLWYWYIFIRKSFLRKIYFCFLDLLLVSIFIAACVFILYSMIVFSERGLLAFGLSLGIAFAALLLLLLVYDIISISYTKFYKKYVSIYGKELEFKGYNIGRKIWHVGIIRIWNIELYLKLNKIQNLEEELYIKIVQLEKL